MHYYAVFLEQQSFTS